MKYIKTFLFVFVPITLIYLITDIPLDFSLSTFKLVHAEPAFKIAIYVLIGFCILVLFFSWTWHRMIENISPSEPEPKLKATTYSIPLIFIHIVFNGFGSFGILLTLIVSEKFELCSTSAFVFYGLFYLVPLFLENRNSIVLFKNK